MGEGSVFLEDSEGRRHADPSAEEVRELVHQIGGSLEHCILHLPGHAFLQCAGDASGLLIQYSDGRELFESGKSDFAPSTVAEIFIKAMNGDIGWKDEYVFRSSGSTAGGERVSAIGSGFPGTGQVDRDGAGATGGSLKDQLLRAAKREISSEASRGLGNLVRKGIRSITRR